MQKIRKGDSVVVLSGKDKGRKGEVLKVMPKDEQALVSGINIVKRHQRQTETQEAGIISRKRRSICPTWQLLIRRTASRPASVSASRTARRFVSQNVLAR